MTNFMIKSILYWLVLWTTKTTFAQRSPYSLQAAVDELRRHELQLALKDNNYNPSSHYIPPEEDDYWDGIETEAPSERRKLNRLLAKYLERDDESNRNGNGYENDFDDDNYIPLDERKRSFFRERDDKSEPYLGSVFREREFPISNQQELTEKFLREIEEGRDIEREEKYKEALRNLWEKYQQQENEIEDELFDEKRKKRFAVPPGDAAGSYYVGPLMQRKRSYPVLPWLPYEYYKKKRFPVSKRLTKMPLEPFSLAKPSSSKEQISKDLQAIFGNSPIIEEKKKRSANPATNIPIETTVSTATTTEKPSQHHVQEKKSGTEEIIPSGSHHSNSNKGDHHHKHNNNKKDSSESQESHESEEEHNDESHEDEHDESHEHDGEEEEDNRKKKRSLIKKTSDTVRTPDKIKRSNLEVVKEDQIIPGDLSNFRSKKSFPWSTYFGIDRRKKSLSAPRMSKKFIDIKKRSPSESVLIRDEKPKKRVLSEEKLDQMDSKLKSIEDLIIDETIKYTGAHEGISDPEEIRELKDHVLSRLATAYNLEKMRRALEKLKLSFENENHLIKNEIEAANGDLKNKEKEAAKRLSVKKEKVQFDNKHHQIDNSAEKQKEIPLNKVSQDDDEDKKKKKRNGGGSVRYSDTPNDLSEFEEEIGAGHFEPHNDVYLGRQNNGPLSINQCPIIDSMSERCRNVDILSGDVHQDLLPICGVHELCYLCGISPVACDLQYLSDADSICGHNSDCQSAARSVLMILRDTPGPQLGPKECVKNPCLYRVMREIGL